MSCKIEKIRQVAKNWAIHYEASVILNNGQKVYAYLTDAETGSFEDGKVRVYSIPFEKRDWDNMGEIPQGESSETFTKYIRQKIITAHQTGNYDRLG